MVPLMNSSYTANEPNLKPEAWQTWGVGMAIVTISAFASPSCILFVPLLNKKFYERVMTFLVALGIGALSGSVIFIMLPQAFGVSNKNELTKSLIILGSLYAFFAVDRIIKFVMEIKRRQKSKKIHENDNTDHGTVISKSVDRKNSHTRDQIEQIQAEIENAAVNSAITRTFSTTSKKVPVIIHVEDAASHANHDNCLQLPQPIATIYPPSPTFPEKRKNQRREGEKISVSVAVVEQIEVRPETLEIPSIAYMILFGSSANNFVDGMSNGVAFANSFDDGISIGISCIAQQFPQELGTLAILIQSGLGLKKTLLLNFIPGGLSYLGFIMGALLDDYSDTAGAFVFAVSSGMYLYVFLGTLIPEMRDASTELMKNDYPESIIATILQTAGLLFGLSFIYVMQYI